MQEFLGAPHRVIALSYLRASWQAEDRPAVCQRLLEKARAYCIAALKDLPSAERRAGDLALVCGEIERRLGKWDDAEKRFRVMENAGLLKGTRQAGIPALQLRLIAKQDSAPHLLDDADTARSQLPEILAPLGAEQPLRLENPGPAAKPDDALKLAPPPKAPSPFQDPLAPAGK